jgi:hypothetical protein
MKKLFFLFLATTFISSLSFATILRVGYKGPIISGVDYANLQSAYDAATIGDTLMFYPGSYNMGQSDKRLVFLGYGYFLSGTGSNANLQNITGDLNISLQMNAPSSGSIFEGIQTLSVTTYFGESVNDVTIRRCGGSFGIFSSPGTTCNNWKIIQCTNAYISPSWSGGKATNFQVHNSIIKGYGLSGSEHIGIFNNCYFESIGVNISNSGIMFQNCIFQGNSVSAFSNAIFQNCLFDIANPGLTGTNNQFEIKFGGQFGNSNTVFVGHPIALAGETEDGKYKLKPGSPAIGAGIGGIDLGIFGGVNPYRLSGIPSIPTIYKLEASSLNATTNPYTITFSTRSNN